MQLTSSIDAAMSSLDRGGGREPSELIAVVCADELCARQPVLLMVLQRLQ